MIWDSTIRTQFKSQCTGLVTAEKNMMVRYCWNREARMQNKSIYKHSWGQFEKRINYELDWGLLLSALSKLGLMEEIVLNENDQQYCTPKIW